MICFMWRCGGLWRYIAFVISRIISFLHTVWKWLWFTTHAFPLKPVVILVVNQHTVSSKVGIPVAANMYRSFKFKQMGLYCIIQAYIYYINWLFLCTSKNFVFIDQPMIIFFKMNEFIESKSKIPPPHAKSKPNSHK